LFYDGFPQNLCYTSRIFVMSTPWLRRIRRDTWKLIISRDLNKKNLYVSRTTVLLAVKNSIMSANQTPSPVNIQGTGWKSNPKLFKWALVGVIFAGVSYLTIKNYRVAYCQDNNCDPKDPLDKFIDDLKDKLDISWDKIQDSLLTAQMKETVNLIGSILESLKEFEMPEIEYQTPRPILLAVLKKTQEYIDKQNNLNQEPIDIDETEFKDAKDIGQYALNVYAASWAWMGDPKDAAVKMGLSEEKDEVILTWFEDKEGDDHCPKFMVFTDHSTKSIVLAVRGTYSLADVIVDIICDEEKFLDGFAHRGILKGANRIMKESGETLKKALAAHPDHRLVITGHSLGAGTAILITMAILSGNFKQIVDPNLTSIKCIALAPPPVYRSTDLQASQLNQNINIFVNGNDCVPRLSLANMAKLLATLRAIDKINLSVQDTLKILAGLGESEVNANLNQLAETISKVEQKQFPQLQHPGKVFYLRRVDSKNFRIFSTPEDFFSSSLLLFENMALDHLQPYYEEAFANVKLK